MDTNIVGKSHLPYVHDQIKVRQEILGKKMKSSSDIVWENGKSGWVRLASSVDLRDSDILVWSQDKKAWVPTPNNGASTRAKLLELEGYEGSALSRQLVLQGGTTGESAPKFGVSETNNILPNNPASYGFGGTEFGLVPMPGITSFQSETRNNGSLRFATLQIRANNRKQFEYLEAVYLRLGYVMLLEWGNSKYPEYIKGGDSYVYQNNNYSLISDFFNDPPTGSKGTSYFYTRIEDYRKKSNGNYDGFLGRVTNFSWEFLRDGSYLITLKLITIGSVIESLKLNVVSDTTLYNSGNKNSNNVNKQDQSENSLIGFIKQLTQPLSANYTNSNWLEPQPLMMGYPNTEAIGRFAYSLFTELFSEKDNLERYQSTKTYNKIAGSNNNSLVDLGAIGDVAFACRAMYGNSRPIDYLRFGTLLQVLNDYFVVYGNTEDMEPLFFTLDTNPQYCFSNGKSISSDPTKLIVRYKSKATDASLDYLGKPIEIFNDAPNTIEKFHTSAVANPDDLNNPEYIAVGDIMNLYFSKDFLISAVNDNADPDTGEIYLYKFLKTLVNEANILLGRVNKINLRIVDKNFGTYEVPLIKQVIEFYDEVSPFEAEKLRNAQENDSKLVAYGFNDLGEGSIIENFTFKTQISKDLDTMIAVGAQANGQAVGEDATLFSKWNIGLVDRIMPFKLDVDRQIKTQDEITKGYLRLVGAYTSYYSSFSSSIYTSSFSQDISIFGYGTLNETFQGYGFPNCNLTSTNDAQTSIAGFVETQTAFFNKLYTLEALGLQIPTPFIGFLPVGFELTLDGLSGIRIFDRLRIDSKFLPSNYQSTLDFIITKLNHRIENNRWITELGTISIPRFFGKQLALNVEAIIAKLPPITTGFENLEGYFGYQYSALAQGIKQTLLYIQDNEGIGTGDTIRYNTAGNLLYPNQNKELNYPGGQEDSFSGGYTSPILVSIGKAGGPLTIYDYENLNPPVSFPQFKLLQQASNTKYYNGEYYLARPAAIALFKLAKHLAANNPNQTYTITSAYRNNQHQAELAGTSVAAAAGSSAHNWGGAIDIQELTVHDSDGNLSVDPQLNQAARTRPAYLWLEKEAPKFGWYNPLRLRDGSGQDEAWHWEWWGTPGQEFILPPPVYNTTTSYWSYAGLIPPSSDWSVPDNNSLAIGNGKDVGINDNGKLTTFVWPEPEN